MSSTAYEAEPKSPAAGLRWIAGPLWLVVLLVAAGFFFREGLGALADAWQTAEYSHGPLIPMLSGLLFLRHLKVVPVQTGAVPDRWPGFLVLLAALALGALGKFARIDDVVAYALIGFVGGVILVSFGWRQGLPFWPSVLHLTFMLPLPATLYWKLSTFLQSVSSQFGVWMIQLMDIPVYLDGNIIDLGIYKLHVAEACSGLRYLFPIMSFSYVFATLYKGPVWHKAVLLLSAAPLAVLMNSIRIGIIGIVVNYTGLEHVEGITHLLEGWVIFITCVLLLFLLARIMLLLQRSPMTLAESLDLSFDGLGPQAARLRFVQPSVPLILSTVLFAAAALGWQMVPSRGDTTIRREPLAMMPLSYGDWNLVATQTLDRNIERALGADDYIGAVFERAGGSAPVDLFIAWYADQTDGGIHSPEVCLPGGGWEMAEIFRTDVGHAIGAPGTLPVNRAIIQKGEQKLLVYYWFEQYGGRTASDFLAKMALLKNAVRYGRTDGALVRMLTPIQRGETPEAAEARLQEMLVPLMADLRRFVPRH
jgi:exosortase D (VPLPA-CTERM-specific)